MNEERREYCVKEIAKKLHTFILMFVCVSVCLCFCLSLYLRLCHLLSRSYPIFLSVRSNVSALPFEYAARKEGWEGLGVGGRVAVSGGDK